MATGAAAAQAATKANRADVHKDDDRGPGSVAGNLTADPDLRFTASGRAVANLRVAASERKLNKATGEWEDGDTLFYDITAWGQLAENLCEHLQRGDRVVAEGRWTSNTFEDKDGQIQERVFLTARDCGPSLLFRGARIVRPDKRASGSKDRPDGQAGRRGDDNGPGGE